MIFTLFDQLCDRFEERRIKRDLLTYGNAIRDRAVQRFEDEGIIRARDRFTNLDSRISHPASRQ